ncbi:hypothetical protein GCM10023079_05830 [Streptomyces chitinivorans]
MLWGSVSCGIDVQVFTQCRAALFDAAGAAEAWVPARSPAPGAALSRAPVAWEVTSTVAARAPAVSRLVRDDLRLMGTATSRVRRRPVGVSDPNGLGRKDKRNS